MSTAIINPVTVESQHITTCQKFQGYLGMNVVAWKNPTTGVKAHSLVKPSVRYA